jgi:hypothetical protein
MGSADIAVVTTDKNQTGLSVPSKTYSYLAVGAALLCLADKDSELGRMVETHAVGRCFNSNEVKAMASFIEMMADNPSKLVKMKQCSREVSLVYSPSNAKAYVDCL